MSNHELRVATITAFVSYARYWSESFRVSDLSAAELADRFCLDGLEYLDAGIAAGKGVILGLAHIGSWDHAGSALAAVGYPMTVVVEAPRDKVLFDWFVERRRAMGLNVVGLGRGAASEVLQVLRSGGLVGLVCDRDLAGTGVPVELFGEVTKVPAGPATLALRSGAMLLPTGVYDEPNGVHRGVFLPPLDTERRGRLADDVTRITTALATQMEGIIRRAPEQWHLFQPNWPSDPGFGA